MTENTIINRQKHVTGFDRHEEEGEAHANKKHGTRLFISSRGPRIRYPDEYGLHYDNVGRRAE